MKIIFDVVYCEGFFFWFFLNQGCRRCLNSSHERYNSAQSHANPGGEFIKFYSLLNALRCIRFNSYVILYNFDISSTSSLSGQWIRHSVTKWKVCGLNPICALFKCSVYRSCIEIVFCRLILFVRDFLCRMKNKEGERISPCRTPHFNYLGSRKDADGKTSSEIGHLLMLAAIKLKKKNAQFLKIESIQSYMKTF